MFPNCFLTVALLVSMPLVGDDAAAGDRLVVHEWGTFTSFQNERGEAFRYLNTNDEPVPGFVHELRKQGVYRYWPTELPPVVQGAPLAHEDVTMRLETPVIYFHPPKSHSAELTLDVDVEFHGGWLTQFYPTAEASVIGAKATGFRWADLNENTVGQLSWKSLNVGSRGMGPETTEPVWTAPRAVAAAQVSCSGESERFLFYRGVAHLEAPLRVVRDKRSPDTLHIVTQADKSSPLVGRRTKIDGVWLADVRPDGTVAFRALPELMLDGKPSQSVATTAGVFGAEEYSKENLARLRAEMRSSLEAHGLFADEGEALLRTWELSYFQSPGLRLFFMVPRDWTDQKLPLSISVPADIVRVMVGRIELVTPRQRETIRRIAQDSTADLRSVVDAMRQLQQDRSRSDKYKAIASGRGNPDDLGVPVPESYRGFLELGRFRIALLLDVIERDRQAKAISHFLGKTQWKTPSRF